jgi:hypothetical protein
VPVACRNAQNEIFFDIDSTGNSVQIAWTAPGSAVAFLTLPGPDALVRNGKQLFGNFTPQPASSTPNGFAQSHALTRFLNDACSRSAKEKISINWG